MPRHATSAHYPAPRVCARVRAGGPNVARRHEAALAAFYSGGAGASRKGGRSMGEARRIADALLLLADAHEVSLTAIRLRRSGGGDRDVVLAFADCRAAVEIAVDSASTRAQQKAALEAAGC
jgi:hypothetical protein